MRSTLSEEGRRVTAELLNAELRWSLPPAASSEGLLAPAHPAPGFQNVGSHQNYLGRLLHNSHLRPSSQVHPLRISAMSQTLHLKHFAGGPWTH